MKVILLKTDKKPGKENDIIEVADAYARNVLIPKKIAVQATKENISNRDSKIASEKYLHEVRLKCAQTDKKLIEDIGVLNISMQCSKDGKMFGSVTNKDISLALAEKGIEADKHNIIVPGKVIKDIGEYTVNISLFENISVVLPIKIEQKEPV